VLLTLSSGEHEGLSDTVIWPFPLTALQKGKVLTAAPGAGLGAGCCSLIPHPEPHLF
jgi:hypothetical protein